MKCKKMKHFLATVAITTVSARLLYAMSMASHIGGLQPLQDNSSRHIVGEVEQDVSHGALSSVLVGQEELVDFIFCYNSFICIGLVRVGLARLVMCLAFE